MDKLRTYFDVKFTEWIIEQNYDAILYIAQYGLLNVYLNFILNNCKVTLKLDYDLLTKMGL